MQVLFLFDDARWLVLQLGILPDGDCFANSCNYRCELWIVLHLIVTLADSDPSNSLNLCCELWFNSPYILRRFLAEYETPEIRIMLDKSIHLVLFDIITLNTDIRPLQSSQTIFNQRGALARWGD